MSELSRGQGARSALLASRHDGLALRTVRYPEGRERPHRGLGYAQTTAFTTLVLFAIFTVSNARSDERSAFIGMFSNKWLWGALLLSLSSQVAVVNLPFMQ